MSAAASAEALGRIGPDAKEAVPALIAALKDENWRCPLLVSALALGMIGPEAKEAVPALTAALEDKDERVRLASAQAIQAIRG